MKVVCQDCGAVGWSLQNKPLATDGVRCSRCRGKARSVAARDRLVRSMSEGVWRDKLWLATLGEALVDTDDPYILDLTQSEILP